MSAKKEKIKTSISLSPEADAILKKMVEVELRGASAIVELMLLEAEKKRKAKK